MCVYVCRFLANCGKMKVNIHKNWKYCWCWNLLRFKLKINLEIAREPKPSEVSDSCSAWRDSCSARRDFYSVRRDLRRRRLDSRCSVRRGLRNAQRWQLTFERCCDNFWTPCKVFKTPVCVQYLYLVFSLFFPWCWSFERDVTVTILVYLTKEMAAILIDWNILPVFYQIFPFASSRQ